MASLVIESSEYDSDKAQFSVLYTGEHIRDIIVVSPALDVRDANVLTLTWVEGIGLRLFGAEPAGQLFTFSGEGSVKLLNAVHQAGVITVPVKTGQLKNEAKGIASNSRAVNSRGIDDNYVLDPAVFADPRPGGFLHNAIKRWEPRAPLPLTTTFTPTQVEALVSFSVKARTFTTMVSVSWKQYVAAGGNDLRQYVIVAETFLVQADRGNPSTDPGVLRIARSPSGWGLYHNGIRWYDENGLPIISPGGIFWDRNYASIPYPSSRLQVTINDPELYTLISYLSAAYSSNILDIVGAVAGYMGNSDLLVPLIFEDWEFLDRVGEELFGMLPILAAFLVTGLLGQVLILSGHPVAAPIGVAILASVKLAGWILDIQFKGSIALNAVRAGRELFLVNRTSDGKLDALSYRHMDEAVKLVREIIIQMCTMKLLKVGGEAAVKGGKAAAPSAVRAIRGVAKYAGKPLDLTIRPEWVPILAGVYGEGKSMDLLMAAMSDEGGGRGSSRSADASGKQGGRSSGKGSRGIPERAVIRPKTWQQLEKKVAKEFHDSAPKNSATYYTSKSNKLSLIWVEFHAYCAELVKAGLPDPLVDACPEVLKLTRRQLIADTQLGEMCEGRLRSLEARYRSASERRDRMRNALHKPEDLKKADIDLDEAATAWKDWAIFLSTEVGNQKLDLFELFPERRAAHVVDPSFAWNDIAHNLKSEVYLMSLQRLLGWSGGSAMDVGDGIFAQRIMFGVPDEKIADQKSPDEEN